MGLHENLRTLHNEATAVAHLMENLRAMNLIDDESVALSVESETSMREVIEKLLDEESEADADIEKMKKRIEELETRKKMYTTRKEIIRSVIGVAMDQAGIPSIRTAFGTVSAKDVAGALVITTESDIPVEYWKDSDPVLDKKKLTEASRRLEKARADALAIAKEAFGPEYALVEAIPDGDDRREALKALTDLEQQTYADICERFPVVPGATIAEPTRTITIRRK